MRTGRRFPLRTNLRADHSFYGSDGVQLGMMQPYFFPYLGYFGLIHATDCWVVFDTAQYIRRGWVNRNRVLSAGQQPWKYARVPVVKCAPETPICDVRVDDRQDWRQELLRNLDAYQLRRAPYFDDTVTFLTATLNVETDRLSELLIHCLQKCCDYLDLPFRATVFSDMTIPRTSDCGPGDWALVTSTHLRVSGYVNAPGGRDLFDAERFQQSGIALQFLRPELPNYDQGQEEFLAGLSIIDALMWNDRTVVRDMVSRYQLEAA